MHVGGGIALPLNRPGKSSLAIGGRRVVGTDQAPSTIWAGGEARGVFLKQYTEYGASKSPLVVRRASLRPRCQFDVLKIAGAPRDHSGFRVSIRSDAPTILSDFDSTSSKEELENVTDRRCTCHQWSPSTAELPNGGIEQGPDQNTGHAAIPGAQPTTPTRQHNTVLFNGPWTTTRQL